MLDARLPQRNYNLPIDPPPQENSTLSTLCYPITCIFTAIWSVVRTILETVCFCCCKPSPQRPTASSKEFTYHYKAPKDYINIKADGPCGALIATYNETLRDNGDQFYTHVCGYRYDLEAFVAKGNRIIHDFSSPPIVLGVLRQAKYLPEFVFLCQTEDSFKLMGRNITQFTGGEREFQSQGVRFIQPGVVQGAGEQPFYGFYCFRWE